MASSLRRRLVSLPLLFLGGVLAWTTAPLWMTVAVVVDAARRPSAVARTGLFLLTFLALEIAGVLASGALWMAGPWIRATWRARHQALQRWWATSLANAALRLYRMRLVVEGDSPGVGPALVFCRHVSAPDAVLPLLAMVYPAGWRPRYVLKKELTWDPCLDIVGHRLPNAFIDRGAEDRAGEVARIAALAEDLELDDCVVIYPEGTRFSEGRRARAIAELAERDPTRAAWARTLSHTLPPRPSGPLALVAAAPGCDVWFVAHVGFEGTRRLADLASGALVGGTVRVRLWRVPGAEVPVDPRARWAWLDTHWAALDAWVASASGVA